MRMPALELVAHQHFILAQRARSWWLDARPVCAASHRRVALLRHAWRTASWLLPAWASQ